MIAYPCLMYARAADKTKACGINKFVRYKVCMFAHIEYIVNKEEGKNKKISNFYSICQVFCATPFFFFFFKKKKKKTIHVYALSDNDKHCIYTARKLCFFFISFFFARIYYFFNNSI
jgi:hypothetical protein